MTKPRQILPNAVYMATRRTTQRQLLLRPDAQTNNDVTWALGVTSQRHSIDLLAFICISDHLHQEFLDRLGNAPAYLRDLHGLIAKIFNSRFGRFENFWSSAKPSLVRLMDQEAIIEELVYIVTNAVKHGLVERPEEWPGAQGFHALISGKPIKATRPQSFVSRKNKKWPEKVKVYLRIPPEIGDHDTIVKTVIRRVQAAVDYYARLRGDRPVVGRARILRQPRTDTAKSWAPHFKLSPTIATKATATRLAAIQDKREFEAEYRLALLAFRAGNPIPFPAGTYWLARHLGVAVKPIEKMS